MGIEGVGAIRRIDVVCMRIAQIYIPVQADFDRVFVVTAYNIKRMRRAIPCARSNLVGINPYLSVACNVEGILDIECEVASGNRGLRVDGDRIGNSRRIKD